MRCSGRPKGAATRRASRAESFRDTGTVAALAGEAELILSICPPHAALDVARDVEGFHGVYVDANAISPRTRRRDRGAASALRRRRHRGRAAAGAGNDVVPLGLRRRRGRGAVRRVGARGGCRRERVGAEDGLRRVVEGDDRAVARHPARSPATSASRRTGGSRRPRSPSGLPRAEHAAATKGWRWVGEMEEIADTFAAAGQPDGFHRAAAEVYRS